MLDDFIENLLADVRFSSQYVIRDNLRLISSECELLRFLSYYSLVNSFFAPAVLSLVSKISININNSDVEGNVFLAAVDEYVRNGEVVSHKRMSFDMLHCLSSLVNCDLPVLKLSVNDYPISLVMGGYLSQGDTEEDIFLSLGFHLASEYLGSLEFSEVDAMIVDKFISLKKKLTDLEQYLWIDIHKSVEVVHADKALLAIRYLCLTSELEDFKIASLLKSGVYLFFAAQKCVFEKSIEYAIG